MGDRAADKAASLGQLRIGLAAIKSLGEGAVTPIVAERTANGPYTSIGDFCNRVDVSGLNRRTLEALAKAGGFDALAPRAAVIAALDRIWAVAQQETRNRNSGQFGMFGNDLDSSSGGTLLELDTSLADYTSPGKGRPGEGIPGGRHLLQPHSRPGHHRSRGRLQFPGAAGRGRRGRHGNRPGPRQRRDRALHPGQPQVPAR